MALYSEPFDPALMSVHIRGQRDFWSLDETEQVTWLLWMFTWINQTELGYRAQRPDWGSRLGRFLSHRHSIRPTQPWRPGCLVEAGALVRAGFQTGGR